MKTFLLPATLAALLLAPTLATPADAAQRHARPRATYEQGYPELEGRAPGRYLYPQDDPERWANQTYHANGSVNADENFGYTTNGPAVTAAH